MRRAAGAGAALALALGGLLLAAPGALAADDAGGAGGSRPLDVRVTIPDEGGIAVTNAELVWAVNAESGAGAYAGGCNFLSAGAAGDAGRSRVWTPADGFYAAAAGAVRIEKPDAAGEHVAATWDTRCLDALGRPVDVGSTASTSGNRVAISGGTGSVDVRAGAATIRWRGSFTVAFYGGMTYWTATDPVLTVSADGTGTLTATASGYGASREDASDWRALTPATVTLARLPHVALGSRGFAADPAYLGVPVEVPDGVTAQARLDSVNAPFWGAFPQDFVDFQVGTGQASYWYASGGARDRAKPPLPVVVSYDASDRVEVPTPPARGEDDEPGGGGTPPPGGAGAGAASARPGTSSVLGSPTSGDGGAGHEGSAAAAPTVLAAAPLIPVSSSGPVVGGDPVLWSCAGLLAVATLAVGGFLKGWLVLPWAR